MHRILTVLKSEYLRRVRSRGFILTTLLLPIGLAIFMAAIVWLSVSAFQDEDARTIAVLDQTGVLYERLAETESENLQFEPTSLPEDSLRARVLAETLDGYLLLPPELLQGEGRATYYAAEGAGSIFEARLGRRVERVVEAERLTAQQVAPEVVALLEADVPLRLVKLTETGEEAGNTGFFMAFGFGMGFLIFMMMVIYGSVVMQGVIEEKTNRVVEVMVSSVKPFELMMGKVLGIGAMGLTQVVVWGVLMVGVSMAIGPVISLFMDTAALGISADASTEQILAAADIQIPSLSPLILLWFVLYFVLGYLLFASIYAAIGSMVENQQDAQSFLLPVMLPLILSMYTLVPQAESPNSTLALVLSHFPLTSPISMVVRLAVTDVPFWQLGLSLLILAASFVGLVWLAARIYRVGILMYGKKASWKDLMKWVRYA